MSLLSTFEQNVKIGPWLQHVGTMLAFGGLIFIHHRLGLPAAYMGVALSYTGTLYNRIYP